MPGKPRQFNTDLANRLAQVITISSSRAALGWRQGGSHGQGTYQRARRATVMHIARSVSRPPSTGLSPHHAGG